MWWRDKYHKYECLKSRRVQLSFLKMNFIFQPPNKVRSRNLVWKERGRTNLLWLAKEGWNKGGKKGGREGGRKGGRKEGGKEEARGKSKLGRGNDKYWGGRVPDMSEIMSRPTQSEWSGERGVGVKIKEVTKWGLWWGENEKRSLRCFPLRLLGRWIMWNNVSFLMAYEVTKTEDEY